jgi:hypothetical protein
MKKIIGFMTAVLLAACFAACASTSQKGPPPEISQWMNQHNADTYSGMGISTSQNAGDALIQASALARQQLASSIETEIAAITADKRKILEGRGETERIASIENATKQEVRQRLLNSRTFGPYVNAKGDTYVIVYLANKQSLNDYANTVFGKQTPS